MKPSRLNKLNKKRGFTLIELLIGLALSGIVISAIYHVYISQSRSYTIQEQIAEMQQSVRVAMDTMVRDIRMAGFCLSSGKISYYDGSGTAYIYALTPTNNGDNPDSVDVFYGDASVSAGISKAMPVSSAELCVDSTDRFNVGDLVIISNSTDGSLLQVTEVQPDSLKLQHNPGEGNINPPGGHNIFPPGGYGSGSKVLRMRYLSYAIDNTTDPAHPTLEVDLDGPFANMDFQPFVENIEDLQLAYQEEDGSWHYDNTTSSAPTLEDIRAVRINVLARTHKIAPRFTGNRIGLEDHAPGGSDNYRRRLLTTIIEVRNLGL